MPVIPPTGLVDPHGIGPFVDRLGFQAKRSAKTPVAIASALLIDGEVVEALVKGQFLGRSGVCVLTNQRLFMVNDNEWKPDVGEIRLEPGLTVQGWGDERSAALILTTPDGAQHVIEKVAEREAAQDMAQRIRARAGG